MTKFLVNSDLHFNSDIRNRKKFNVEKIIDLCEKENIDALLCPGDLTNNGWDGSNFLCWPYGGPHDQLTPLKQNYVNPLSKHLPVYLCAGNHDYYVPWPYWHNGVLNYIKNLHGNQRYSFDIKDLHFICLDKYPDEKGIKFLKKDLENNFNKNIILFFHYNLTGKWSDWWTDEEKDIFHNTIAPYNIKAICVGHSHISKVTRWRGYKIIAGAGSKIAKCVYENNEIEVTFF